MSTGTITAAQRDESKDWSNDYGQYQVWTATIEANGETIHQDISRKVFSDGGTKGDPTGEAVELKDGKWKVAAAQGGGGSQSGGQASTGGKTYGKSPEEQSAIQRQHSQEMAIRMVAELRELGLRPDGLDSATAVIAYVKTLTDHFEKDIAS